MLLISFYICLQTFYYTQANELKRVLDVNAPASSNTHTHTVISVTIRITGTASTAVANVKKKSQNDSSGGKCS